MARHALCRDVSIKSGIRNWTEMAEMWMGQFGQTEASIGQETSVAPEKLSHKQ